MENHTRKVIAEDSHGRKFYLYRNDEMPKNKRYTIVGSNIEVEGENIPVALARLKVAMLTQGKLLVTYENLDKNTVIITQKDGG